VTHPQPVGAQACRAHPVPIYVAAKKACNRYLVLIYLFNMMDEAREKQTFDVFLSHNSRDKPGGLPRPETDSP